MFKKTILLLAMGLSVTTAFADEYNIKENKYRSPKDAHALYLKTLEKEEVFHYQKQGLEAAKNKGSKEAQIYLAQQYFLYPYAGSATYKKGLNEIEPILNIKDPVLNFWAYQAYSRIGNQNEAQKYIEIEKKRSRPVTHSKFIASGGQTWGGYDSKEIAWFNWNYARYTGNGYFNAPYEPQKVCDEVENKYKAKKANAHEFYLVGRCYFDGVARPKDEEKGLKIFQTYRDLGVALDTLGILSTTGVKNTNLDINNAIYIFRKDIHSNNPKHLPETAFYHGMAYMLEGTGSRNEEAYEQFKTAADMGHKEAQWLIAQNEKKYPGKNNRDLSEFIPYLPQENTGKPRFPLLDLTKGVKATAALNAARAKAKADAAKQADTDKFVKELADTCNSVSIYSMEMMLDRQHGKSKAELLKEAREYKGQTFGGLGTREMLVNEAFKKPIGNTSSERQYYSDLFLATAWNACQDVVGKKYGVSIPPFYPPKP